MSKKIKTEDEVKALLQIDDWRLLSKDKIMKFISLIPNMDKELSLAVIEQFPNFVTMSKSVIDGLLKLCDNACKEIGKDTDKCILAYRVVLDSLNKQLDNKELTLVDKENIINQMLEVANKIAEKDSEKKQLIANMVHDGQKIMVAVLALGAAVLGYNVYNNKK